VLLLVVALAGCGRRHALDQVRLDSSTAEAGADSSTPTTPAPPVGLTVPTPTMRQVVTPPPPSYGDGRLDCLADSEFEATSDIDEGVTGYESSQRAVEIFLLQRALAFQIRTPAPTVGTVVLDGREVLRAEADELADGTYRVVRYSGCADEPPGPEGTTPELAQPCPNPGPIYSEEPVGPLEQTGTFRPLFDVVALADGRRYSLREFRDRPVVLGAEVGVTECRIADGSWPDGRLRSGDATLLPVGTPLYAVDGEPIDETIAVDVPEGPLVYQYVGLEGAAPLVTPSPAVSAPSPVVTNTPQPTAGATPVAPTSNGSG
jgi:hypothetical protein